VFTPGPDPVTVVPDWAGAGDLLDRLHRVGDPFCFLRPGQVVLPLPAAAVRAGLVAASDDLRGDLRVPADRVADHERGHLDLVLVQQVQDAGHALARPVLVEGVLPQVGEAIQDRLGDRAAGAADRLAAASNCTETLTAKRAPSGQNSCCSVILLSLATGTRLERGAPGG